MEQNMDDLETLTDSELRLRMLHYGLPNVPITSSTRKLLVKRLRNHYETQKKRLHDESKNLTQYSSGEDSDFDPNRDKYRAIISSVPKYSNAYGATVKKIPDYKSKGLKQNISISPTLHSDNEDEIKYKNYFYNNENNFSYRESDRQSSFSTSIKYPSNLHSSTNNHIHLSNGSMTDETKPFVSDFTKRLLKLREETVKSEINSGLHNRRNNNILSNNYDENFIKQNTYHNYSFMHTKHNNNSKDKHFIARFKRIQQKLLDMYGMKQPLIPYLLVTGFAIFLLIVICMYLTISPDINNINPQNTYINVCDTKGIGESSSKPIEYCIHKKNIESSLHFLKILIPELQHRAIIKNCKDFNLNSHMTTNEIVNFILENHGDKYIEVKQIILEIKNFAFLIYKNNQWRINVIDMKNLKILNINEINLNNIASYGFDIRKPKLPISCIVKSKLYSFFFIVGLLAITILIFYSIQFIYKILNYMKQSKQDKLNLLINEIIVIAAEKSTTDNPTVVLNHLRDKLTPINKRKEMEYYWNEAMKYLEKNESRLHFDICVINGEECKVIRWIDSFTSNDMKDIIKSPLSNNSIETTVSSNNQKIFFDKKWQSPAFDKCNKIIDPPTPCLKIRQMFDKYESKDPGLKTIIQDSILEKVGNDCIIYDVQLDTNSCCVYVRCASSKDAGIVHDKINGWWFDNRLVSIKFVRLERYLMRFPKSQTNTRLYRTNLSHTSLPTEEEPNENENDDLDYDIRDGGTI